MIKDDDKRKSVRLNAEEDFRDTSWAFESTGLLSELFRKRFAASVIDISVGGIGIVTIEPARVSDNIDLTICYKNYTPFLIHGRVRSCRLLGESENEEDGKKLKYYKIGLQLESCTKEMLDSIQKVVKLMDTSTRSKA